MLTCFIIRDESVTDGLGRPLESGNALDICTAKQSADFLTTHLDQVQTGPAGSLGDLNDTPVEAVPANSSISGQQVVIDGGWGLGQGD